MPRPYLSDHRLVIIETNTKGLTEKNTIQGWQKLTEAAMTELQQSFNNQPILDVTNLEDAINQLNNQVLRNLHKVPPMKRRRSLRKAPKLWYNKDLLNQRKILKTGSRNGLGTKNHINGQHSKGKEIATTQWWNSTRDITYSQKLRTITTTPDNSTK